MAVNGIEIRVGQKWRTRDGTEAVISGVNPGSKMFPWVIEYMGSTNSVTDKGFIFANRSESTKDLVHLTGIPAAPAEVPPTVASTDGFTQWTGGAQPLETLDMIVQVIWRASGAGTDIDRANSYGWAHCNSPGDIMAYKILRRDAGQGSPSDKTPPFAVADGFTPWDSPLQPPATLSRMVQVAGKSEHPTVITCPADKPNWSTIGWYKVVGVLLPTAPDLLDKAAGHMRERAKTYDLPAGERSMAQTVALFNLHHGTSLTEAQGWHFMQILKDVRLFSAKGYHADSAEDGIAYKALMAEAKAKEGPL